MFENPFRVSGNWYRANLHVHTTVSDGDLPPDESVAFYERLGYDILAVTDHFHVTEVSAPSSEFLVLRGIELSGGRSRQGTNYHIVGLNVGSRGSVPVAEDATAQDLVDTIRAAGGAAILAHPYWSGLVMEDMVGLEGCFALEVYNTLCDVKFRRGHSMVHWDNLLSRGRTFGGLATDDGHLSRRDCGLGWTMIRADELTAEAVVDALKRGRYYASNGPEIRDIEVSGEKVAVETSPVVSIALVSEPQVGVRVFATGEDLLTRAELALPKARYCRVEVIDQMGRSAWSNPVVLDS